MSAGPVFHGDRVVLSLEDLQKVGPARLRRIVAVSIPWADPATVEAVVVELLAGRPVS